MYRHNILKFSVFKPKRICYKQNKFPKFQVLKKKKSKQSRKCLPSFWYLRTGKYFKLNLVNLEKSLSGEGRPSVLNHERIFKKYFQWFTDYKEWKLHQIKAWGASKGGWFGLWLWWKRGKGNVFGHVATLRWQNPNCPWPSLLGWLPAWLFFLLASSTARNSSATATKNTCGAERNRNQHPCEPATPYSFGHSCFTQKLAYFWVLEAEMWLFDFSFPSPRPLFRRCINSFPPSAASSAVSPWRVCLMINVNLVVKWSFFQKNGTGEATNLKPRWERGPWELWGQPQKRTEQSRLWAQDSRVFLGRLQWDEHPKNPKTTGAAEPSPQIYPQNSILGTKGCGSTLLPKRQSPKETQSKHQAQELL